MSPTACFFLAKSCDEVAVGRESPAGADADAYCGTEALGLSTVDSGIDDACACVC